MYKQKLPDCVRVLPQPAQTIFRIHFNEVFKIHGNCDLAFEHAWQAVRKVYVKGKKNWIKRRF